MQHVLWHDIIEKFICVCIQTVSCTKVLLNKFEFIDLYKTLQSNDGTEPCRVWKILSWFLLQRSSIENNCCWVSVSINGAAVTTLRLISGNVYFQILSVSFHISFAQVLTLVLLPCPFFSLSPIDQFGLPSILPSLYFHILCFPCRLTILWSFPSGFVFWSWLASCWMEWSCHEPVMSWWKSLTKWLKWVWIFFAGSRLPAEPEPAMYLNPNWYEEIYIILDDTFKFLYHMWYSWKTLGWACRVSGHPGYKHGISITGSLVKGQNTEEACLYNMLEENGG